MHLAIMYIEIFKLVALKKMERKKKIKRSKIVPTNLKK